MDPWKKTDRQKFTDTDTAMWIPLLRIRIWNSGSGAFLPPESGMSKKSASGSGKNNADHISESA
jgi:hypothetical protein